VFLQRIMGLGDSRGIDPQERHSISSVRSPGRGPKSARATRQRPLSRRSVPFPPRAKARARERPRAGTRGAIMVVARNSFMTLSSTQFGRRSIWPRRRRRSPTPRWPKDRIKTIPLRHCQLWTIPHSFERGLRRGKWLCSLCVPALRAALRTFRAAIRTCVHHKRVGGGTPPPVPARLNPIYVSFCSYRPAGSWRSTASCRGAFRRPARSGAEPRVGAWP